MKKVLIFTVLLGTVLMGRGYGQNRPSFGTFDSNGDGRISQSEFSSARSARRASMASQGRMMRNASNAPSFSSIDSNGDGYISQSEFTRHRASRQGFGRGQGRGGM